MPEANYTSGPEYCPHCNRKIGADGCWPYEEEPECWELKHLSASEDVTAEVWVTKGSGLTDKAAAALAMLSELEHRA